VYKVIRLKFHVHLCICVCRDNILYVIHTFFGRTWIWQKILLDLEFLSHVTLSADKGKWTVLQLLMEWGEGRVSVLSLSVFLSPTPTSVSARHIPTCAWTHHIMLKSVSCIVFLTARKILLISWWDIVSTHTCFHIVQLLKNSFYP
jgi:hypothetical protein